MGPGGSDAPTLSDARSFEAVFVTEYPRLVALAAATSGSRAHAEDIAQEAMARLDRHWSRVGAYDKAGAWVRRVTINLALSHRRRFAAEAKARLRLGRPEPALPPTPTDERPLWAAVASLPAKQRTVIALHFLEDLGIDEIAEILEIAPATVRVHMHRARRTLRAWLSEEDPS